MIDVWFLADATAIGLVLVIVKTARCIHRRLPDGRMLARGAQRHS